jgi:hypothetical protein
MATVHWQLHWRRGRGRPGAEGGEPEALGGNRRTICHVQRIREPKDPFWRDRMPGGSDAPDTGEAFTVKVDATPVKKKKWYVFQHIYQRPVGRPATALIS